MVESVLAVGTQFKLGDGASPEVFTKIAKVHSFGEVSETSPLVDDTTLDSTAGKEYIAGIPDGSELEVRFSWISGNAQQIAMRSARGTTRNFEVEWPDGDKATFAAVVLSFGKGAEGAEDRIAARASLKISGGVTWTDAP